MSVMACMHEHRERHVYGPGHDTGFVLSYTGSDACCVFICFAMLPPSWLLPTGKPRFGACLIVLAAALPAAGGGLLSWVALSLWE